MKKLLSVIILILSLAPAGAERSPLLSPLAFDSYRTSSFGEYRYNHFHGGVDYSTNGEEGYPVLAVGDGRISRIKREAGGYGRALYLDLKDGRTAVYGHLIRFSRKLGIEQKLIDECEKLNTSFPGDIFISPPIEVRAGDTVAYSGQLGIGSPHLHLEIRRGDSMLDPFNEGVPLPEFSTPKINAAYFAARSAGGSVNGSFLPFRASFSAGGGGAYQLVGDVVLSGETDILLDVSDNMGSATYTTLPAEISASVDGREFFYLNLKDISLAHYKESIYLFEPLSGGNPLILLRTRPELKIGDVRGGGLPLLEKGTHRIEIKVTNRGGKSCSLKGSVIQSAPPPALSDSIGCASLEIARTELLSTGVFIKAARSSEKGTSLISAGGRNVKFFLSGGDQKNIEIMIPTEELGLDACKVIAGGRELGGYFFKGPSSAAAEGFRLNVPSGVAARFVPNGNSVSIETAPSGLRPLVRLSCQKKGTGGEALYCGNGEKYFFSYLGAKEKDIFKARNYQIMKDTAPPEWGRHSAAKIRNLGEPELKIPVSDKMSGVDPRSISIFVDSKRVFPDWDSDASMIRLGLMDIPKGSHTLTGFAADKMGNRSELPLTQFFN